MTSPSILTAKKILFFLWIVTIIGLLGYSIYNPMFLDYEHLKAQLASHSSQIMLLYTVLCLIRGAFLLPSTPFVISGALLFPDQLWFVFFISQLGIFASATILYFFSSFFGFDTYFEKKYPEKIKKIQQKVNSPQAFGFVVAWSAFPLVPTDLLCYIAGTVRMNFMRMLVAMMIGEIPLVYLYVFHTQDALALF